MDAILAALRVELSEQSQGIAESKQELCELASDNLYLRTRLGELEEKISPKDKVTILVSPKKNDDIPNNSLVSHAGLVVSETGGKATDGDSVELESEVATHISDISTFDDLQEIVDRSYQGVLPRNGNVNVSFSQATDSSTPFRPRTTDCLSTEEQFCAFKANIESILAALRVELSEQSQVIAESKQELCKLASDNLYLRTRLGELEEKISPKDKVTILVSPKKNDDIPNNSLVNKSQPALLRKIIILKMAP